MIRLFDDQSDAMSERDDLRVVPVQVARDLQYMYIYGSTNRVSSVGMYLPDDLFDRMYVS